MAASAIEPTGGRSRRRRHEVVSDKTAIAEEAGMEQARRSSADTLSRRRRFRCFFRECPNEARSLLPVQRHEATKAAGALQPRRR